MFWTREVLRLKPAYEPPEWPKFDRAREAINSILDQASIELDDEGLGDADTREETVARMREAIPAALDRLERGWNGQYLGTGLQRFDYEAEGGQVYAIAAEVVTDNDPSPAQVALMALEHLGVAELAGFCYDDAASASHSCTRGAGGCGHLEPADGLMDALRSSQDLSAPRPGVRDLVGASLGVGSSEVFFLQALDPAKRAKEDELVLEYIVSGEPGRYWPKITARLRPLGEGRWRFSMSGQFRGRRVRRTQIVEAASLPI